MADATAAIVLPAVSRLRTGLFTSHLKSADSASAALSAARIAATVSSVLPSGARSTIPTPFLPLRLARHRKHVGVGKSGAEQGSPVSPRNLHKQQPRGITTHRQT